MQYLDADHTRWVINDHIAEDLRAADASRLARMAQGAKPGLSLRERAGAAIIALGERLAGDRHSADRLATERTPMTAGHGLAARA